MNNIKYSVLMSVYSKEKPEYLKESIDSMINQTIEPDEIVLIKDGLLTDSLYDVISQYEKNPIFKSIQLENNVGLGKALNIGLSECRNEIVVRMDTDDISESDRCEKQIPILINNNLSVVGSSVAEFIETKKNIIAYKDTVESNNDILRRMKYRNAINHPTVVFKKTDVLNSGGYQDFYLNEDYSLWIRMILKGYMFRNIKEPLVNMRINNETYLRRGGFKYFLTQKKLFDFMLEANFINYYEYIINNTIRFFARVLITNNIRKTLYLKLLRRSLKNKGV